MADSKQERDLRHYLRVAWRWKWLFLAIVVLIPIAVYLVSARSPDVYEASTTLFVQSTNVTSPDLSQQVSVSVSTSSPENVARLIDTPLVGNIAAKKLGEPVKDGRSLLDSISATLDTSSTDPTGRTNFLTITATAGTPQRAAAIARAFADAVAHKRTKDAQQAIDQTIENLSAEAPAIAQLGETAKLQLADQLQQLRTLRSAPATATQVVDPVQLPTTPISPTPKRNAALGFIFALLLAAGLLPLLDRLDRKLRAGDEVEPLVGAPLLGMIPEAAFPGHRPTALVRESFQTLRAGLTSFNVDRSLTSVAVASATHGDGKTTVATNLAAALAVDERDVILVDGDMRKPQAATRLGVDASIGLDAVLLGERSTDEALVEVQGLRGGRLRVLPAVSPPPNPSVLLGSQRMSELLSELTEIADMVVIDTPPLLVVSDAIPLFKQVSGTVLVVRVNQTTRDAVSRSRQVIASAGGTILGAVATATKTGGLYGYGIGEYMVADSALVAQNGGASGAGLRGLTGRLGRVGSKQHGRSS